MIKEYFSWIVIVLCAIGVWQFNDQQAQTEGVVRILTGRDGTQERYFFELLGQKLRERTRLHVEFIEDHSLSNRSMLLRRGEAELTVLPLGDLMVAEHKLVFPLWENYLQILVKRESKITNLKEMKGRRIAIGLPQSATRNMARKVLWSQAVDLHHLHKEAMDGDLVRLLTDSQMEGAIVNLSPFDPAMRQAMENSKYQFLPVPHAEGLAMVNEGWEVEDLPSGVYPTVDAPVPPAPVKSLVTLDVLVAGASVSKAVIQTLYEIMSEAEMYQKIPVLTGKEPAHPRLARVFEKYSHQHADRTYFAPNLMMNRFFDQMSHMLSYKREFLLGLIGLLLLNMLVGWVKGRALRSFDKKTFLFLDSAMHEMVKIEDEVGQIADVGALSARMNRIQALRQEVLDRLKRHELMNSALFTAFIDQYARLLVYLRERIAYEDARER